MQKLKKLHMGFLTLLITGFSVPVMAQTSPTDYTQTLPTMTDLGLDPAQVEEASRLATAPQGTCEVRHDFLLNHDGTSTSGGVFDRRLSNISLRTLLRLDNLDSDIKIVEINCQLLKPGEPLPDASTDSVRFGIYKNSARGLAKCMGDDLSATSLEIPMYIEVGVKESEFDRFQCVMWFVNPSADGSKVPRFSIDLPVWAQPKSGTELVNTLSGPLKK